MPKQHQVRVFHDDDKKVADIREVFAGLERAFHAKDTEKFDSHFTADAVFVTPAGTMLRGWEEICAYHEENLGGLDDEVHAAMQARYTVLGVNFLSADTAVVHTRQTLTTPSWEVTNIGTAVLAEHGGQWRICALQNNNLAPAYAR